MLFGLGCGLFSGCKSALQPQSTEIYVFPKLKYTDTPEFSFTKSERNAALEHLKRLDGELLYEVVADREGNVIRIRTVKSLLAVTATITPLGSGSGSRTTSSSPVKWPRLIERFSSRGYHKQD